MPENQNPENLPAASEPPKDNLSTNELKSEVSGESAPPSKVEAAPEKSKATKKTKLIIISVIALVLIAILGALAYFLFFADKKENKEESAAKKATESAKQSSSSKDSKKTSPVDLTYCTNGKLYENKKQGYKVCLIKGWYTQEFSVSAATVGFDPNPIPEASEYGGVIVVDVSAKSVPDTLTETGNNIENEVVSNITVDGVSGKQLIGDIPADNFYYANYKEIASIFSKFNRTYRVTTISQPEKLTTSKQIHTDFLASWRFIAGTPNPPWSTNGKILVDTPWPGDKIGNPVTISGQASVFEGTVNIRIKDANGTVLTNTTAQGENGMELSSFSKSVSYTASSTTTGIVEVFSLSMVDGTEQDLVTIPVKF